MKELIPVVLENLRTVEHASIPRSGKVELADEYRTFHACRLRVKTRDVSVRSSRKSFVQVSKLARGINFTSWTVLF